jgi:hypothetical protein
VTVSDLLLGTLLACAITSSVYAAAALFRSNGAAWRVFQALSITLALRFWSGFLVAFNRGGWTVVSPDVVATIVLGVVIAGLQVVLTVLLWRERSHP